MRKEEEEFLWIFHFSRYPLADPESENAIKQRLRNRIRSHDIPLTPSDHILISLVHVCDLTHLLFSDEEMKKVGPRIAEIANSDRIGHAVEECLNEIGKALLELHSYSGL